MDIRKLFKDFFGEEMDMFKQFKDSENYQKEEYEKDGFNVRVEKYEDGNSFFIKKIITSSENTTQKSYFDNISKSDKIKKLENELEFHLSNEEYEKCALIRDEIKKLKEE